MPIQWPGERTTARHELEPSGEIHNWFGGLVDDMRDASGQMYRRNRYYDPQSGQFTQPDPIGLAGGMNAYGFANGDPVTYADPYGLFKIEYGDDKSKLTVVKLRWTSLLIAADLEAMEADLDIFLIERGDAYYTPGNTAALSVGLDGVARRRITISEPWVGVFASQTVVKNGGGISVRGVYAHEIHAHAGPTARGEDCDDAGGSPDSCGIQAENEYRREQGVPERTYGDVHIPQGTTFLPEGVKP